MLQALWLRFKIFDFVLAIFFKFYLHMGDSRKSRSKFLKRPHTQKLMKNIEIIIFFTPRFHE